MALYQKYKEQGNIGSYIGKGKEMGTRDEKEKRGEEGKGERREKGKVGWSIEGKGGLESSKGEKEGKEGIGL